MGAGDTTTSPRATQQSHRWKPQISPSCSHGLGRTSHRNQDLPAASCLALHRTHKPNAISVSKSNFPSLASALLAKSLIHPPAPVSLSAVSHAPLPGQWQLPPDWRQGGDCPRWHDAQDGGHEWSHLLLQPDPAAQSDLSNHDGLTYGNSQCLELFRFLDFPSLYSSRSPTSLAPGFNGCTIELRCPPGLLQQGRAKL